MLALTSSAFQHNAQIPAKYTCDGENVNPLLAISGAPETTQSFVLIVDDPDAPMGTWDHWVVWNIPPVITEIAESNVPHGAVQGTTSFDDQKYGGPCPPSGTHRYFFKLYALDTMLQLPPSSRKAVVEAAMQGHILEKAELIGLYSRK